MYEVLSTKTLKFQNFDPNTNPYFVLGSWYIVPPSSFLNRRSAFDIIKSIK